MFHSTVCLSYCSLDDFYVVFSFFPQNPIPMYVCPFILPCFSLKSSLNALLSHVKHFELPCH